VIANNLTYMKAGSFNIKGVTPEITKVLELLEKRYL
jgi:hypothetical protein